ncbi:MAG: glycosyltransferase [Tepidisphaerales bacterium]
MTHGGGKPPAAADLGLGGASLELTRELQGLAKRLEERDQRIRQLSRELADRSARIAVLESALQATAVPVDPSSGVATLQVFWTVHGTVTEAGSVKRPVREDGSVCEWLLSIPAESEGPLRIDLGNRPGFWEVLELAVFGVDADGSVDAVPRTACDVASGFDALEPRTGLLRLAAAATPAPAGGASVLGGKAAGGRGAGLRLYVHTDDPQLHWPTANAKGPCVLRIRVRAMGMLRGLMSAEAELFQSLLRTALSEGAHREKQWHDTLQRAVAETGLLREARQQLAAELQSARAAENNLKQELERLKAERDRAEQELSTLAQAKARLDGLVSEREQALAEEARRREALAAELASARKQGQSLAEAVQSREKALHELESALASARRQLEQAARTSAELAELKSSLRDGIGSAASAERQRLQSLVEREQSLLERLERERERLAADHRWLQEHRAALEAQAQELGRELEVVRRAMVLQQRAHADAELARRREAERAEQRRFSRRLMRRIRRTLGLPVAGPVAPPAPPDGLGDPLVRELFDAAFYREQVTLLPDDADALEHYLSVGWLVGADPMPLFSTRWYLERNPDLAGSGVCPLVHYVRHGGREGRDPHPLFDTRFYLHHNAAAERARHEGVPPLVHYLRHGERCPQPLFDEAFYLHTNPDVARAGVKGFLHFCRYGYRERRQPHPLFDTTYYLEHNPDVARAGFNALAHYVACGSSERRSPHPLFDNAFYLRQVPGVDAAGLTALDHYLRWGWKQGHRPHPAFDPAYYLRENPDVAAKGLEPLTHFVQFGWKEHRDPNPHFDTRYYLLANPDVGRDGVNPLVHYLQVRGSSTEDTAADDAAAPPLGRLVVLRADVSDAQAAAIEAASPVVRVIDPARYTPDQGDYVHAPCGDGLTAGELRNVALCLAHQAYGFVVVSRGLAADDVVAASADDALVLSAELYRLRRAGKPVPPGTTGRLVRLMGTPARREGLRTLSFDELGLGKLVELDGELAVAGPAVARPRRVARRAVSGYPVSLPRRQPTRPLVWAMPMMLAVGGVERNMVELMRELGGDAPAAPPPSPNADAQVSGERDGRFDFFVVTTERLRPEQGSLHHQAEQASLGVIDIGELAPPERHLDLLSTLKRCTSPAAVWLCNGTPWLAEHADEFRTLLSDTALIDQQVYDAETGWIAYFDRVAAFRQADRYVAINSRIRDALIEKHGLDPSRIDLIYHLIDDGRFRRRELSERELLELRRQWGLPESGEVYAQVGRLTDQKQPLRFLELARRVRDAGIPAHFALVGSGELADACEQFIQAHGLTNVTRISFVEDMSSLLPALSGLVMCSKYEGLPIVILESLAMGVPVLSTDVGDVRLVLETYGSGTVVADASEMFEAWMRFREDLPRLRKVAADRADEVRERFSRFSIGQAYRRCFHAAMTHRRGLRAPVDVRDGTELTVVMPTYNRAETLERTLRSCLRYAAGLPVDFVVVDDGSRDATPAVLQRLSEAAGGRLTVRRVANGGPGKARNLGATLARGSVLLFMGDDAEPASGAFFTTHLDLHRRQPARGFAVLGKMVWPDDPDTDVSFVMQHIQGHGGEQFGYADLTPYTELDWRFFYTANLSVKRNLVDDWTAEGFSPAFRFAAWEDAELAYRMSLRSGGDKLRLLYAPTSLGFHHHPYSVDQFLSRQVTAGMMLRVMLELHPELTEMLVHREVRAALDEPIGVADQTAAADLLAAIEGIKAWARLLERRGRLGRVAWHQQLLYGVFELAFYQGYLLSERRSDRNVARALERLVDRCIGRAQASLQHELLGYRMRSNKLVPTA